MPSRPEKTVSMYQEEQADTYTRAMGLLESRGEIDDSTSQGEELATLSRQYIEATQTKDSDSQASSTGISRGTLSFILMLTFTVLAFGGFILGVGYLAFTVLA